MTNEQLKFILLSAYRQIEDALESADAEIQGAERNTKFNYIGPHGPENLFHLSSPETDPDEWEEVETTVIALDQVRDTLARLKTAATILSPTLTGKA